MSIISFNTKSINITKHNPSFHVINALKWRTQTSWSCSNPIIVTPLSTKINVTSSYFRVHKTKAHVVSTTTPGETKLPKGWFWFREWDLEDVASMCSYIAIHVLAVCAPFVFDWGAFWVAVGLSVLTWFGVKLGYHRLLCHQSFKIPKWLEYFFVYCGAHAFQAEIHMPQPMAFGTVIWVGFVTTITLLQSVENQKVERTLRYPELKVQWFYRFLHDTYFWHPTALAALLYLHGGLSYLGWGMGMRGVVVHQSSSLARYISHMWGERPWNTSDSSTNNWWVAILTLGEGWHNNHHAFPRSTRHGLEWWQFDMTWELIKFFKFVGLATDVKLPTEADKRRILLS